MNDNERMLEAKKSQMHVNVNEQTPFSVHDRDHFCQLSSFEKSLLR